jgi:hypothetical protein
VIAFFARQLLKDLRLVGGYDQLHPKVKTFVRENLFTRTVDLDDPVILRNLSEPEWRAPAFNEDRISLLSPQISLFVQPRSWRPRLSTKRRILQNRSSLNAELSFRVPCLAVSETGRRHEPYIRAPAYRTYNATRPVTANREVQAVVGITKELNRFNKGL